MGSGRVERRQSSTYAAMGEPLYILDAEVPVWLLLGILVRASIAVKRHHDHSNAYKGKHLIEADLHFQRI